ncbi:MAG: hypothetical protein ACREMU_02995, partial [Gemmatimonadaceae bacterium]
MTYRNIASSRRLMIGGIALLVVLFIGACSHGAGRATAATQTNGAYLTTASVSATSVSAGSGITIKAYVRALLPGTALVDIEVYGPAGKVVQDVRGPQAFAGAQTRSFITNWAVPSGMAPGAYTVRTGVFSPDWSTLYRWNNNAATFQVTAAGAATATPTRAVSATSTPSKATATPTPIKPTATSTRVVLTPTKVPATATPTSSGSLPPLPAGWPSTTLQLGMADSAGGAANLRNMAPFGFRYQYLSAGVNTGVGWATWNANGSFATNYIQDSISHGMTPVFTYYMMAQSAPGNSQGESNGVYNNLQNTSTMIAYFDDLKLFFQRAGAFPNNRV